MPTLLPFALALLVATAFAQSCTVNVAGSVRSLTQVPMTTLSIPQQYNGLTLQFSWTISLCALTQQVPGSVCAQAAYVRQEPSGAPCSPWLFNQIVSVVWTGSSIVANYSTGQQFPSFAILNIGCGSTPSLTADPGSLVNVVPWGSGGYTFTFTGLRSSLACPSTTPAPMSATPGPAPSSCAVSVNGASRNLAQVPMTTQSIPQLYNGNTVVYSWTFSLCALTQQVPGSVCSQVAYVRQEPMGSPCSVWAFDLLNSVQWTGAGIVVNYGVSTEPGTIASLTITCGKFVNLEAPQGSLVNIVTVGSGVYVFNFTGLQSSIACP